MRIKYNILWIENEEEWLKTTIKFVARLLDDNGFDFVPTHVKTKDEVTALLETDPTFKKFDLILVDFQLDKGERGDAIIENIREHKIYTEIIFYSQDLPGIRKILSDKFIDGIYAAHRNGAEFREKVEKVFLSTIKKAQDISNVRGLVMSETSELDNKVYNIVISFFKKYPLKEQESIREYIFQDIIGNLVEKGEALKQVLYNSSNESLINHGYFDAYKKARVLGRIIELLNNKTFFDKKTFSKRYISEIIDIRNELAHCIESVKGSITVLETKNGDKVFDDDACRQIRQNIREHYVHLTAIEKHIQEVSFG